MSDSERIAHLVATMTLEEKVAQLICIGRTSEAEWLRGSDGGPSVEAIVERYPDGFGQLGRPSQKLGPAEAAAFTTALQESLSAKGNAIGALFNEEGVHGHMAAGGTHFPAAIALASSWDVDLVEDVYAAVAREVRARGSNYVYAPVLDLARDPRWGRVEETFGEDPHLVSRMGVAAVRGLQGGAWDIPHDKVLACAKHFAGHGVPEGGRNAAPVHIGERELRSTHLVPFRAVVDVDVGAIMAAYHDMDGIPCHASPWLLTEVLRDEWGFEGMVSSDGFGVPQLADVHRVAADDTQAGVAAITAGIDAEVPEGRCFPGLVGEVLAGRMDEAIIDRALARVLGAKDRLGLLDQPSAPAPAALAIVNSAAHRDLARRAAQRSAVLLTNDGILPIDASAVRSIAVIGPNAADIHLGGYSDDPGTGSSVLEGIIRRFGASAEVRHGVGCVLTEGPQGGAAWWDDDSRLAPSDAQDDHIAEAVEIADGCDVAIMVIGGNEATAREAWAQSRRGDRDSLELIGRQIDLLEAVAATGTPMVAVVMGGRPLDLRPVVATCGAILQVWYPGQEGGEAIAGLLAGDVAPSGKLPITFPSSVGQVPNHASRTASDDRDYVFSSSEPLFAFGHGLTYTTFTYGPPRVEPAVIPPDGVATVEVDVTNSGSRFGEDVVQLYVSDLLASVARPHKALRGFRRVALEAGESQIVRFELSTEHLGVIGQNMERVVEPGTFDVGVGGSPHASQHAILTVE